MSSLEKQARTNVGKKLMKLIEANPYYWEWTEISKNPNITMEIIEANPYTRWDYWSGISRNPNLTMEFIRANPDKRWDWGAISNHPNLTMEFIEAKSGKLWDNRKEVCSNKFQGEYKKELERLKRRKQLIHNRYAFRKQIGLGM